MYIYLSRLAQVSDGVNHVAGQTREEPTYVGPGQQEIHAILRRARR